MGRKILIIGSSNTDMVIKSNRIPVPGETVLGGEFFMNPGGKGANQAVAAARLGGEVYFICKVGNDSFGHDALALFKKEGINVDFSSVDPDSPSGIAMISVDEKGENSIVVAPGSNNNLNGNDLNNAQHLFEECDYVLLQLEIPIQTVKTAINIAAKYGKRVILNPAPATKLPDDLFKLLYAITPNETEAELITGIEVTDVDSATEAGRMLLSKGVKNVVVTMGKKGALIVSNSKTELVKAPVVKAIDTTAAGDTFNGAFVVGLSQGMDIITAVDLACKAASISVTRMGAQASIPQRDEIII